MKESKNTLSDKEMATVAAAARNHIETTGSIKNSELRALTGINYDQAIWFFNQMIEQGMLIRVGVASSTKYLLAPQHQPGS